jgi:hypothetical protein
MEPLFHLHLPFILPKPLIPLNFKCCSYTEGKRDFSDKSICLALVKNYREGLVPNQLVMHKSENGKNHNLPLVSEVERKKCQNSYKGAQQ